ncbi:MAG: histidinol-phosphatase HisJ family protein [Spirochaetia bacterium]|nr:histidinol-phosphatase HisJ family protein [Spirochaetia bacterium]
MNARYNLTDFHLHTNFSWDAEQTMEELVDKAIENRFRNIATTEHLDFHKNHHDSFMYLDYGRYTEKWKKMKGRFPGLLKGVEVGEPNLHRDLYEKWMEGKEFDFIMASTHWIDGLSPVYDEYFSRYKNPEDAYQKYFEELYKLMQYGNFDAAAHITLVHRNGKKFFDGFSYENFRGQLGPILELMIEKEIALEVNCSGLRFNAREVIPGSDVIKAYIELGGKYLFLGSDAHVAGDSFFGIEAGYRLLDELGVREITVFEGRKKRLIPLRNETSREP